MQASMCPCRLSATEIKGLIDLHPSSCLLPAVVGLLRYPHVSDNVLYVRLFTQEYLHFPQFCDDLFRFIGGRSGHDNSFY